jgi:hypothetical protein
VQDPAPEIMLSFRDRRDGDDGHLFVQHTGGGSARNIQVERMVNGSWAAESDLVPFLRVGGTAQVITRFLPIIPESVQAQARGGYMRLSAFVMGLPNGDPVPVTVKHEDATQQWEYETDFEIVCPRSTLLVSFVQKDRRIKRRSSL